MRRFHGPCILVVFSGILATASETRAAAPLVPKPNLSKKHKHAVHGVVTKTHFDRKTNKGTITIRIHHHHKVAGSKKSQVTHKTFHVNSTTTFERTLVAGKGEVKHEPATFRSLRPGEHVAIVPAGKKHHEAKSVNIVDASTQRQSDRESRPEAQESRSVGKTDLVCLGERESRIAASRFTIF